jgi:hypothetical protein
MPQEHDRDVEAAIESHCELASSMEGNRAKVLSSLFLDSLIGATAETRSLCR